MIKEVVQTLFWSPCLLFIALGLCSKDWGHKITNCCLLFEQALTIWNMHAQLLSLKMLLKLRMMSFWFIWNVIFTHSFSTVLLIQLDFALTFRTWSVITGLLLMYEKDSFYRSLWNTQSLTLPRRQVETVLQCSLFQNVRVSFVLFKHIHCSLCFLHVTSIVVYNIIFISMLLKSCHNILIFQYFLIIMPF